MIKKATILLSPIIPESSQKYLSAINADTLDFNDLKTLHSQEEYKVVKDQDIVFARIDANKKMEEIEADQNPVITDKELIDFEQFTDIDMVVGEVLESKVHPDADRLLISQIDVGTGVVQIVSGIAEWCSPQELIGKHVIVVRNLKPIKLRGVESQGMILVSKNKKDVELLTSNLPAGSSIA